MSFDYKGSLDKETINAKAKELADKLRYKFDNIDYLCEALYCQKIYGTKDKYTNSAIALIGDNVLKLSLSQKFYMECADKEYINNKKEKYETNEKLKAVCELLKIYQYAFNDENCYSDYLPDHKKIPRPKHDPYVEAVIGAMYLDKGLDYTSQWIDEWLVPYIDSLNRIGVI